MPASTKAALLAVSETEYAKLSKLIVQISEPVGMGKVDDLSIRDVLGHRGHWIALFLGWHRDGMAGKKVFFPAEGYKWNDLKRYNADLRSQQAEMGWDQTLVMLRSNHKRLLALIEGCSEQELYGGPMRGANNKWTVGRWAEAAGPSHYRSATKAIRAMLKSSQVG